jgi:hypothetical protein
MSDPLPIASAADLEAVVLAESFDLLASVVGPYMYRVIGEPGAQQALFASAEVQALFFIRSHEFLAEATYVSSAPSVPRTMSLLRGGSWISNRHPERAEAARLADAYRAASEWFTKVHRIVFWAPSVWRHLRLELPMSSLISMRANLEKHQLLRLTSEIHRLRSKCNQSGCELSVPNAIAVKSDFDDHIKGMLHYHATEIAEHLGRCFYALYRYVCEVYRESPTNSLDQFHIPADMSDETFRYMYASVVLQLSGWSDDRILSSTPETAPAFKMTYPQHATWESLDFERGEV